jgi:carboxylate-amine ligase
VSHRSLGIEEEFLLVEPATGRPQALAGAVMQAAADDAADGKAPDVPHLLEFELQKQQLEINTRPCGTIDDLGREIARCRSAAAAAAGRVGAGLAALGTSPVPVEPALVGKGRYRQMAREFAITAHEQLTCGCHVHVAISSREEGVAVLDRVQPWLAPLLALSANSPFWKGRDSAYASFRYQAFGRWPCAGPTAWFGSARAYAETVQAMIDTETVLDAGMVYFDARLSARYPTIEVRIADVCLFPDDAVLIAALVRALVETEAQAWREQRPGPAGQQGAAGQQGQQLRQQVLQLAAWRASRSGLEAGLVHPVTGRPEAAASVVQALVDHVRPALAAAGDLAVVTGLLSAVLGRGNGARIQRQAYGAGNSLLDVVGAALSHTVPG